MPPAPPALPMEKVTRDAMLFPNHCLNLGLQMRTDVKLRYGNGFITVIILEQAYLRSSVFVSHCASIVLIARCLLEELCSIHRYKRTRNYFLSP